MLFGFRSLWNFQQCNDSHASNVGLSSWEHPTYCSGPPQDQDWRNSLQGLEPHVSSWESGAPNYNYGYPQGDWYQNDRGRCANQVGVSNSCTFKPYCLTWGDYHFHFVVKLYVALRPLYAIFHTRFLEIVLKGHGRVL